MNIENSNDLLNYLKDRRVISENTEIQITPLSGGVSNRTVKIDFKDNSWVLKQALDKLRVDGDWFSAPERIFFEGEAIRWLDRHLPGTCPKLIFEDQSSYILAMETVRSPFENLKTILLTESPRSWFFMQAGNLLGRIHAIGQDKNEIPQRLFDTQFFESLRIAPYYLETSKQLKQTEPFYENLIAETRKDYHTFVHGDYSPKNLLVKDQQLILLDHEVTHFGDSTFDLGFFITHLLAKSIHLPKHRQALLSGVMTFFDAYKMENHLNQIREQRAVRQTIGCLLARVCGLSPLEYLSHHQKEVQKSAALTLVDNIPSTIKELTSKFNALINA